MAYAEFSSSTPRSSYWSFYGITMSSQRQGEWQVMRDGSELIRGAYAECVMFAEELCERIKRAQRAP